MVLSRWAMTKQVRCCISWRSPGLDQPFALGVEVAGGFVEDEDSRVGQNGPGDGDPLPLSAAEFDAPFADDRVIAVRQLLDELRRHWRSRAAR